MAIAPLLAPHLWPCSPSLSLYLCTFPCVCPTSPAWSAGRVTNSILHAGDPVGERALDMKTPARAPTRCVLFLSSLHPQHPAPVVTAISILHAGDLVCEPLTLDAGVLLGAPHNVRFFLMPAQRRAPASCLPLSCLVGGGSLGLTLPFSVHWICTFSECHGALPPPTPSRCPCVDNRTGPSHRVACCMATCFLFGKQPVLTQFLQKPAVAFPRRKGGPGTP